MIDRELIRLLRTAAARETERVTRTAADSPEPYYTCCRGPKHKDECFIARCVERATRLATVEVPEGSGTYVHVPTHRIMNLYPTELNAGCGLYAEGVHRVSDMLGPWTWVEDLSCD